GDRGDGANTGAGAGHPVDAACDEPGHLTYGPRAAVVKNQDVLHGWDRSCFRVDNRSLYYRARPPEPTSMPARLRSIRKTFNTLMTLPRRTVLSVRNSIRAFVQFLHLLSVRLREDRLIQVAGSLTFTMLLSLVPLLTIALTVFSAFPGFAGLWTAIRSFILTNLVPTMAGKVVGVYMQQFAENAGRLTALGLVMIAVTAVMMMHTIEGTFNTIWRVRRMRPLISRVLIFWGVMTIGPLLIGASLSLTSWLVTESMGLMGDLQRADLILLKLIPAVLTSSAFALLYRTVPNRRVGTRDALVGGVFAGVLFEGMKA